MHINWRSWAAAVAVLSVLCALVVLDLADTHARAWFSARDFTTSALSGLLVLLVTVLIFDHVAARRRLRDRSRLIAAQAAIVTNQATRTSKAVAAALGHASSRAAIEENSRYMTMLLISAPLFMDGPTSRVFLEEAQWLAGEFDRALAITEDREPTDALKTRLHDAVERVRATSRPLVDILDLEQRLAIGTDDRETV